MAHSLSARKRTRQNAKRRMQNRIRLSDLKTQIKKFLSLVHDRKAPEAGQELRRVYKKLDQVAAKGTIHVNAAARKKARLAKRLAALGHQAGTPA